MEREKKRVKLAECLEINGERVKQRLDTCWLYALDGEGPDSFGRRVKPSMLRGQPYPFLYAENPKLRFEQPLADPASFVEAASVLRSSGKCGADELCDLAREHRVMVGKWMCFVGEDRIDELWTAVCESLDDADGPDSLGRWCPSAKVSLLAQNGPMHVVIVYSNSFDDGESINGALRALRGLPGGVAIKAAIHWKPDFFTYLNIDTKTKKDWKLSRVSLWSAAKDSNVATPHFKVKKITS